MRIFGLYMLLAGLAATFGSPYFHDLYLQGEASEAIQWTGYTLILIGLLAYLFGGRKRHERESNAPSGTQSHASQIGRRTDAGAPEKTKKIKWGRGNK